MARRVQRTPAQIERDRAEIKRLGLQGRRLSEMHRLLNTDRLVRERGYKISHSMIREDHDALIKEMRQEMVRHYGDYVKKQMKEIDKEERRLWQLWEKSKEGGKVGEPRYLNGILKCVDRRCKLLGLYPKKQKRNTRKGEYIM